MTTTTARRSELYYEELGRGAPILLVHPSGATAATWGDSFTEELARVGRVIMYDRRGYARSGGDAVRSVTTHAIDAAALLQRLHATPAVVVGTSAGATIALDLAVSHPELVRTVIAHEAPWRFTRHRPTGGQIAALMKIASLAVRGRHGDAVEVLLRNAYGYRDGGSAWEAFPDEWHRVARENAKAALADFRSTIGNVPSAHALQHVTVPVLCTYGERSADSMQRLTRRLASAIPTARACRISGAAHAAPFDATSNFVQLIAGTIND